MHRQVAHKHASRGRLKCESLCQAVQELNPRVKVVRYPKALSSQNALEIFRDGYDVILDATDNPASRYLINDACQLAGMFVVLIRLYHTRCSFTDNT